MVLLYYLVHKIYYLLFRKTKKSIDPRFFFTKQFGFELFVVGMIALLLGGILFWIGTKIVIIGYGSLIFLILGGYMIYRGLLKMILFSIKRKK